MACRDITLGETFPNNTVKVYAVNLTDIPAGHIDTGKIHTELQILLVAKLLLVMYDTVCHSVIR